jgi:hypothetical protein
MESEAFLKISSIGWSAISSIATVLAVCVALLLPFHQNNTKKKNILKVIKSNIKENYETLVRANKLQEATLNSKIVSRVNMMCAVLINIDIEIWNNNKQTIAELSSTKYEEYSKLIGEIERIKKHTGDIVNNQGISPCVGFIEEEVDSVIKNIAKWLNK